MAKVVGTGKDPLHRYGEGIIADLGPDELEGLVAQGYVRELAREEWPGTNRYAIAHSVVRGDPLVDPVESKMAAEVADDAHAIVHLQDPGASRADADPDDSGDDVASAVGGAYEPAVQNKLGDSPKKAEAKAPAESKK